jgi:hypothetical protein
MVRAFPVDLKMEERIEGLGGFLVLECVRLRGQDIGLAIEQIREGIKPFRIDCGYRSAVISCSGARNTPGRVARVLYRVRSRLLSNVI